MQGNERNLTVVPLPLNQTMNHANGTDYNTTINDSVTHSYSSHCVCANTVAVTSPRPQQEEVVEIEAFMYIVFVIAFYATSIVFLLIKYARNDDEDKNLKYQYSEFVKRERFQAPQYKNKLALERTKLCLENIKCNGGLSYNHHSCPLITITTCSDGSISSCNDSMLNGAVVHATDNVQANHDKLDDADNDVTNDNCRDKPCEQCDVGIFSTDNCILTNHCREHIPCDLCEGEFLGEDNKLLNDNGDPMSCDHCDDGILRAPLTTDTCRGGTSLSYDSGVDYFGGLELDEMTLYDWATYRDTDIVRDDILYIKSHTI